MKECLSLYPSACIIISIIQVFEAQAKRADSQLFAKEAIQHLEEQLNLVDLIISSVTGYDQQVKEAVKVIKRKIRHILRILRTKYSTGGVHTRKWWRNC